MRSIELFAGCGGLALGLSRAGFTPKLVVENDPYTLQTLRANHSRGVKYVSKWPISDDDVRRIVFDEVGEVELVSGGPPCQPFSIGGNHLGPQDPRNMWPDAIRAIRQLRPQAFVFENVRGLMRPAFKVYLDYITKQLQFPQLAQRSDESWICHLRRLRQHANGKKAAPAYRVLARAINAADFGAAQKRHRTIILGMAASYGSQWRFPDATHSQAALVWSKHIVADYWERHGIKRIHTPASQVEIRYIEQLRKSGLGECRQPWRTVRDALANMPPPSKRREPIQGHWQHEGARPYHGHTGSNWDEPAKALKAGVHGVPGGENMIVGRRGKTRYFTVREMARLQGFPDEFVVLGSWKAATRQLGNAVPTVVGEAMGRQIRSILLTRLS